MTNIDLTNSRIACNLNGAGRSATQNHRLHALVSRLGAHLRRVAARWEYNQRCRALSQLSDVQLSRLGIQRRDIPRYALVDQDNGSAR
ncbi:DUF1127 domain-containing protein [Indioceanicola profundi]|uniref:hypothetical protein n=1 Tax=Indioceanicola profundi TaxID=2220096 RepID=UPI000E6AA860|nr:hypothetical protein [Indioceanicola profundi]